MHLMLDHHHHPYIPSTILVIYLIGSYRFFHIHVCNLQVHDFSVVKKEMNHQFGFPVNYVGFSIKTVPYQHKDSPRYVHVSI